MEELTQSQQKSLNCCCYLNSIYYSAFLTQSQPIIILQISKCSKWKLTILETTPLLFFNKLCFIFQSSLYVPRVTRKFYILPLISPREIILPYFPQIANALYKNQIVFLEVTNNISNFKQQKKKPGIQLIQWFMTNPFWAIPIYTFICRVSGWYIFGSITGHNIECPDSLPES